MHSPNVFCHCISQPLLPPPFRHIRPCKTDQWQLGHSCVYGSLHNECQAQSRKDNDYPHHRTDASWLALVSCSQEPFF